MDRLIVYPSEQPTDTVFLSMERNKMLALGRLAEMCLGSGTVVGGLSCIPTVPATLAVQVGPGAIYQLEPVDTTSYGSLGVDTVDQVVKQGLIQGYTQLTLTPPSTAGQAISYLIQAELLEQDTNAAVLSYFNSANPEIPFTGPGGSGTSQPTVRQCSVALVAKAGVAGTAGSQAAPAPDAGYVGLYVITVAQGVSGLTASQISQYSNAPFVPIKLPAMPGYIQGGTWSWGSDTGTANQIVVSLTPTPGTIAPGFEIRGKKIGTASNGPMTVVVNGATAIALINDDGSAMSSTIVMPANFRFRIMFDGTSWSWTNGPISTAVGSLAASSGEGVVVSGSGVTSLNYPGLSVEATQSGADLWSFFSQADSHHRVISWAQLLSAIQANLALPSYSLQEQIFSTVGVTTLSIPTGITRVKIRGWGGGAGGGGASGSGGAGSGGGGGGYAEGTFAVSGGQTLQITVGGGGAPGAPAGNGANGGTSTVAVVGGSTLLGASGGSLGQAGQGGIQGTPGVGGSGYGGSLGVNGYSGGLGFGVSGGVCGGFGGGAFGGAIAGPNVGAPGLNGSYPGGGGSGGAGNNYWGGTGANGLVIIEY